MPPEGKILWLRLDRDMTISSISATGRAIKRKRAVVHGAVQGIGFRPFVFRLAQNLGLAGWVMNNAGGVVIEVEGTEPDLATFERSLRQDAPPAAIIRDIQWTTQGAEQYPLLGNASFEIRESSISGEKAAEVFPDLGICAECLAETLEPGHRRSRYPFTNCASCGPRYSIINGLPYDRQRTTMHKFLMCALCRSEYEDPLDRRFHAQPIACPACGPHLEWWDREGRALGSRDQALLAAAQALREGKIVAVKGLGGFHLMVDARNEPSVRELRRRKRRPAKPFAVLFPTLESLLEECEVSMEERSLLRSPAAPIVLVRKIRNGPSSRLAPSLAPDNPTLGAMFPSTPLQALLMMDLNFPLVATSGNLSEEPICTDEREAVQRLSKVADYFLVHNRPIARAMDDSVVKMAAGRPMLLRGGRGHAPLVVPLQGKVPSVFAVGGHQKNTVAVSAGSSVIISQHLGDLDAAVSRENFLQEAASLQRLYDARAPMVARDFHADYFSTSAAEQMKRPLIKVQHHHAHVVSVMAEQGLIGSVLGVCWDGSGYGTDGTVWGGEFLVATRSEFTRVGSFRRFPLPGAEAAVREPRRTALGLLAEMRGSKIFDDNRLAPVRAFTESERRILRVMLKNRLQAPMTSSVGRLFDAVASLLNLRQRSSFEAQAAMDVEFAVPSEVVGDVYPVRFTSVDQQRWEVDWQPLIEGILRDLEASVSAGIVASRFHNTLVEFIAGAAKKAAQRRVVLTGGCFQNSVLLERAIRRLRADGFEVYWPHLLPANDGGLSLGQAVVAISQRKGK